MKKFLIAIVVIIALIAGLKYYFNQPERIRTRPEKAVEEAGNYIPNKIEQKNNVENKINDSMQKENERLQKALQGID